ncbi:MAG: hypothetical protein EB015_21240 [Methylocystaceae bacterium]|nr:hypothetical protein [Methylocystaceae bacterium]
MSEYPADDPATIALLEKHDVIGITFVETPLVIRTMRLINPRSPAELSLCLALVRPGPDKRRILAQLHQQKSISNLSLVYDDDVIQYISEILDVDVAEGDTIRKVLSKNREADWDAFEQKLLDRWSPQKAEEIIANCKLVRRYTFCKSHSYNYAYMCWAMLWHKAHNPGRFWAAVLTHANSQYERWVYYREAIDSGWEVELAKKGTYRVHKNYLYVSDTPKRQSRLQNFFSDTVKHKQLQQFGFWIGGGFQCCYVTGDNFSGLIACYRIYKCDYDRIVTFVTIGVGDRKFFNVTIEGKLPRDAEFIRGTIREINGWEILAGEWEKFSP